MRHCGKVKIITDAVVDILKTIHTEENCISRS